jgi:tRNA threonylcarbamoyladenosine biosynthesis protein TsaB
LRNALSSILVSTILNQSKSAGQMEAKLLLGIDTCGPVGSVALGRLADGVVEILGQTEIEGRSCSSMLVTAIAELLVQAQIQLSQIDAMVVVNGPGSFTGVRVGVAAVKGLAEGARIPVVVASRLAVLAFAAGTSSAALDAHRQEVYLRLGGTGDNQDRELLAGAQELAELGPAPSRIAVCDEAAADVLKAAWPAAELLRTAAPTAADALRLFAQQGGEAVDLAMLDGHYLRRSDAEIFGEATVLRP